MFEYEIEECDAPAPEKIEFYYSLFTYEPRAKCTQCPKVFGYWECACELEHECVTNV